MKFGAVSLAMSEGAIVAHAIKSNGLALRKGDIVHAEHIAALHEAGVREIVVARLEPGDVGENEAAHRLALSLAGDNLRLEPPFTGRCNLMATCAGVFVPDRDGIDRINGLDESITVAILKPYARVVSGEMVATVKIIPFAVADQVLVRCLAAAEGAAMRIAPFRLSRVGAISTLLPGLKGTTVSKTLHVFEQRLAVAAASLVAEERVPHGIAALAQAIRRVEQACDLVVIFGASAITDRRDIVPAAIEKAGGFVEHFGMPVDPGNLLLIARTSQSSGAKPVIGAPGCARSPKENGFDFVLERMLAGIPVTAGDICKMGVGGLLMEIVSRPQPRAGTTD
ncbi:MAG: molybdopterin-binding protein [Beijerinckiaceae bacterium]